MFGVISGDQKTLIASALLSDFDGLARSRGLNSFLAWIGTVRDLSLVTEDSGARWVLFTYASGDKTGRKSLCEWPRGMVRSNKGVTALMLDLTSLLGLRIRETEDLRNCGTAMLKQKLSELAQGTTSGEVVWSDPSAAIFGRDDGLVEQTEVVVILMRKGVGFQICFRDEEDRIYGPDFANSPIEAVELFLARCAEARVNPIGGLPRSEG